MNEYSFTISYYSEATLLITMRRDSDYYEAECRHPMTAQGTPVPLGESWFFFSGPDWENERLYVRGTGIPIYSTTSQSCSIEARPSTSRRRETTAITGSDSTFTQRSYMVIFRRGTLECL